MLREQQSIHHFRIVFGLFTRLWYPDSMPADSTLAIAVDDFPEPLAGQSLRARACTRLAEAYEAEACLFTRQIRGKHWDRTHGTEAITSTAICLIGLSRAGLAPADIGVPLVETLAAMRAATRSQAYPGSLGLSLWAHAVNRESGTEDIVSASGTAPNRIHAVMPGLTTMELAWLVSGLAHQAAIGDSASSAYLEAAAAALTARQHGTSHLFSHAAPDAPLHRRLRSRVANFADQIYPLQALTLSSMLSGEDAPLQAAAACAERLVALQGAQGQWWWHYNPALGQVVGRYPVYSVHQHGMAPMALRTLEVAGGPAFADAVALSRAWLARNELGVDLVEQESGIIWRDIEPDEGTLARRLRHIRALAGRSDGRAPLPAERLRINHEIRPYEWGWFLFAQAMERGAPPPGHLA